MKIFSLAVLLVLSATAPAGVFLTVDPAYTPTKAQVNYGVVSGPSGYQLMYEELDTHIQAEPNGYGGDWFGNFAPGENVWEPSLSYSRRSLAVSFAHYPYSLGFNDSVTATAFQVQSAHFGGFWTDLDVHTVTATGEPRHYPLLQSTNGMSTGDADGSATWVGVAVDNPNERIAYLAVRVRPLTMATYDQFAVGNFRYGTVLAVPEPSSLGFLALGLLPFLRRRKR
ncbi:PEP-CTERM sorting domain-containing protein [bacterium]|nr:MAG: PEP-CTERM sorting domain-containing protein [bacterium]